MVIHNLNSANNIGGVMYNGKIIRLPFILLLILFTTISYSQDDWTKTNGPNGGAFTSFTVTSNGTIFAGTGSMGFGDGEGAGGNGVYKSNDSGNNWVHSGLDGRFITALEVDNNDHIYAGDYAGIEPWDTHSEKGVFRSTDNGSTWESIGLEDYVIYDILYVPNTGIFVSSGYSKIYKWNGNDWTEYPVNEGSSWIQCMAFNSDGDIFAGTNQGLYRSEDDGATWLELNKKNIYDMIILSNNRIITLTDSKIYYSDDTGSTWIELPGYYAFFRYIAAAPNGYLYISNILNQGVMRSTDNGESWESVNNGLNSLACGSIIANDIGEILVGSFLGHGIFKSGNNGDSWYTVNNGLTNTMITSIKISDNGEIYAGGNSGVHFSDDNGSTWTNLWNHEWHREEFVNDVEFIGPDKVIIATDKSYVLKLTIGSDEWESLQTGFKSNAKVKCLLNINDEVLLAGTDGDGVFRSTDEGGTWTSTTVNWRVNDIVKEPNGDILATSGYHIYRSTDNGITWSNEYLSYGGTMMIYKIAVNSSGDIFLATQIGIYRSSDSGITFDIVADWPFAEGGWSIAEVFDIVINELDHIYAGVGRGDSFGVYVSYDNGNTWAKAGSGLEGYSVRSLALSPNGELFAGTYINGVYRTSFPTGINDVSDVPYNFSLTQNYPNPFNPTTMIEYSIPQTGLVTLKVYDVLGKEIIELENGIKQQGIHKTGFSAEQLASGIYFYRLSFDGKQISRKMLLLK